MATVSHQLFRDAGVGFINGCMAGSVGWVPDYGFQSKPDQHSGFKITEEKVKPLP